MEFKQMKRMLDRKKADGTLPVFSCELPLLQFTNFTEQYKKAFYEINSMR
jgi:hypothetical protein